MKLIQYLKYFFGIDKRQKNRLLAIKAITYLKKEGIYVSNKYSKKKWYVGPDIYLNDLEVIEFARFRGLEI